ncbi:MAG: hypothetical protein ABW109_22465, partial [Candidatus Thiodiazotropha sp. 6PLUC4]
MFKPHLLQLLLLWSALSVAAESTRLEQGVNWDYCDPENQLNDPDTPPRPLPMEPIQIHADWMVHDQNRGQSELNGAVKLWRLDGYAEADRLTYWESRRAA